MDIREYLHSKGMEFKEVNRPLSGPNAIMTCPLCEGGPHHDKGTFAVNLDTGAWNCTRLNQCGKSGSFRALQEIFGDKPKDNYFYRAPKTQKNFSVPKTRTGELSQANLKYLTEERKFTMDTLKKFQITNSHGTKDEMCFPFVRSGKTVNIKHRTRDKKFWQEDNPEPCLFNYDSLNPTEPMILTEGELDCMTLVQYGFNNVVSIPSGVSSQGWIENDWELIDKFNRIYLCMDNDQAGQNCAELLVARLGRWRCSNVLFRFKDANECLQNGVPVEEIKEAFRNAREFPPSTLRTAGSYYEEVYDMFRHPEKFRGLDTGFPGLNYYLQGWRKGEMTIWSGRNSSGKSTILNQVCLFNASQKIKTCIASLELPPGRYLKWMVMQAVGKNVPNDDELARAFAWINEYVLILNAAQETPAKDIWEAFEYAARRYGVEQFIIDSLMRVNLPGRSSDKYEAQKIFTNQVTDFTKRFKAHCHLVAHPRKGTTDDDKPGKVDVAGTGDITNLADNVILMWRPDDKKKKDDDPDAVMIIKKNREFGEEGGVKLWFDKKTKRFMCKDQRINFYLGENERVPF